MATTADAIAGAAAAGAGAASAGAGATSSTAASTGAAGGGADAGGAVLTDDQILGMTEGVADTSQADETGAAEAGAAGAAATGEQTQQQTTQQQTQQGQAGQAVPAELSLEDFKPLFAANPKVQALWDKYDNASGIVRQFGTPAEAREAAGVIQSIGGAKELTNLVAKAGGADQTDAAFWSGDPEQRKALVNEWYDGEGPHEFAVTSQAIAENVESALEVMSRRDPQRYTATFDRMTRQALDGIRHGDFLAAVAAARQSGQNLEEAVDALLQHADRFGLAKPAGRPGNSPEEQRIARQRQELTEQQKQFQTQKTAETMAAVNQELGATLTSEIDRTLGELKVNGRPVFGDKSGQIKKTIAGQIFAALDTALAQNAVFNAQATGMRAGGVAGKQKDLVDLTLRHARLLLPKVVEQVMQPWTESVVSQAQGAADRARAGAGRTEVNGGTASRGGTKQQPFTSDELKRRGGYVALTDEEILNA